MAKVIGIDLGTTYCCVAVADRDGPRVLFNKTGQSTTPSVVAMADSGRRLVGQLAKRQAITNPLNTVYGVKRLIGRRFVSPDVQRALELASYGCVQGPHEDVRVQMGGKEYAIPEISGMVLHEMRLIAERALGEPVQQAVITVPAYFNDNQRQATKDAGTIAGLDVLRIINEPTAAALAYGYGRKLNQKVAIFDLGGGTFDISILDVGDDVFEVMATAGDTFLGGEDFDERIISWLVTNFSKEHGIDLRQDKMALQRLRDAAEKAKIELSSAQETTLSLPFIFSKSKGHALHIDVKLTRPMFNELVQDLVERAVTICERAVEQAGVKTADVNAVVLVGGMTRVPFVQNAVEKFFGRTASKGVHPDEVVACGAAIQGMLLAQGADDTLLIDVTPHDLGIMVAGGGFEMLVEKDTTVPTSAQKIFTTVRDGQTQVRILVMQRIQGGAQENEMLGEFVLDGLRPAPRGIVRVEVVFRMGADGIVSVAARDCETQRAHAITISATSRLTPEEIKRMIAENERVHLAATESDVVELNRVDVERRVRDLDKLLQDIGKQANLPDAKPVVQQAQDAIVRAREALNARDTDAIISGKLQLEKTTADLRFMLERK